MEAKLHFELQSPVVGRISKTWLLQQSAGGYLPCSLRNPVASWQNRAWRFVRLMPSMGFQEVNIARQESLGIDSTHTHTHMHICNAGIHVWFVGFESIVEGSDFHQSATTLSKWGPWTLYGWPLRCWQCWWYFYALNNLDFTLMEAQVGVLDDFDTSNLFFCDWEGWMNV